MECPVQCYLPHPISILILVAANGYAEDIAQCACLLSRDPDFWSYLVAVPIGRHRFTWLQAAASLGHIDRVAFLCDVGAPLEWKDSAPERLVERFFYCGGKTALARACMEGHTDMVTLLLARGANVNAVDAGGFTPIYNAVLKRKAPIVQVLVNKGADISCREYSPLHYLSSEPPRGTGTWTPEDEAIMICLVGAGAGINQLDCIGRTPLDWAKSEGYPDVMEALRAHGGVFAAKLKGAGT